MRLRALLALACVVVAAGCASGGPRGGGGPGIGASGGGGSRDLDGRTFLSVGVTGVTLVPQTQVQLGFKDGKVTASAGCNGMGSEYALQDGTLRVDGLAMTEMGCDPARHQQDTWLSELLTGEPTLALDGDTLVVTGSTSTLTMRDREVVDPDRPLLGTRWTVDTLIQGDSASSVPIGDRPDPFLVIEDQGGTPRATGSTGCNQFGGPVEVGPGELTFGEVVTTKMACGGVADALERAVLAVLTAPTVSYEIEADRLTLRAPDGNGLQLRGSG
jgi:heat shock protein HslJ